MNRCAQLLEEPATVPGFDMAHADWLIWQLADSALPTGSFAHSAGLEAAWQHGFVRNGHELSAFLENALAQTARGALPFVHAAYDEPDQLPALDRMAEAFLANHVANRASRLQGRALVSALTRIFHLRARAEAVHYAPLFGELLRALGVPRPTVSRLFLFVTTRGFVSAGVRLGIVGPMEGQSLQAALGPFVEQLLTKCGGLGLDSVAQTAPVLDICQGAHDCLYSRLFQT